MCISSLPEKGVEEGEATCKKAKEWDDLGQEVEEEEDPKGQQYMGSSTAEKVNNNHDGWMWVGGGWAKGRLAPFVNGERWLAGHLRARDPSSIPPPNVLLSHSHLPFPPICPDLARKFEWAMLFWQWWRKFRAIWMWKAAPCDQNRKDQID
jgi:hypothetical protein